MDSIAVNPILSLCPHRQFWKYASVSCAPRLLLRRTSECEQLLRELRNLIREQSEALPKLAAKKLRNPT